MPIVCIGAHTAHNCAVQRLASCCCNSLACVCVCVFVWVRVCVSMVTTGSIAVNVSTSSISNKAASLQLHHLCLSLTPQPPLSLSHSCVAGNAFWAYLASLCRFCRVRYLYVRQSRLTALERVKSTPYPSLLHFCVNIYTGRPRQLYNYSYYCLDCRLQNVNKNTNGKTKSKKKKRKRWKELMYKQPVICL